MSQRFTPPILLIIAILLATYGSVAQPEITPEVTSTVELETSTPTPTYTATYTLAVDTPAQTEEFTTPTDAGFPTLAPPDFATEEATPAALMLVAPYHGIQLAGESAVLTWSAVPDARWYRLHITGKKGKEIFRRKFTDLSTRCADGFCSFDTTGLDLKSGNYKWWIVARTAEGRTSTPKWKFRLLSPTATPPTTNLPLLESSSFDDPTVYNGWYDSQIQFATSPEGSNALHLTSQASYSLPHSYINDVIMEGRVVITTGGIVFSVRNSGAGGYTATLNSVGQITVYRGETVFAAGQIDLLPGQSTLFRLSAIGNRITVSVDGKDIVSGVDPLPLPYGVLSMGSMWNGETDATLDDFNVWGTQAQEPLQGEDLIERMIPGGYDSLAPKPAMRTLQDADNDDRIYFTRTINSRTHIYSVKVNGTNEKVEVHDATFPEVSPDGEILAYRSSVSGAIRVWIKYKTDGQLELITPNSLSNDSNSDTSYSWSSNSNQLAFVRSTQGPSPRNLYIIDINSKEIDTYGVPVAKALNQISWKPDSMIFAYQDILPTLTEDEFIRIFDLDLPFGQNNPQTISTKDKEKPKWSPDGSKLAYSTQFWYNILYIRDMDSNTIQKEIDDIDSYAWAPASSIGDTRYLTVTEITDDGDSTIIRAIRIIDEYGNYLSIPDSTEVTLVYNLAWGSTTFPVALEKCISVPVPNGVQRWNTLPSGSSMPTGTPIYFPTNSRLQANGRVVQLNGEWLRIDGIIPNNSTITPPAPLSTLSVPVWVNKSAFQHTPTGTITPGSAPQIIDICDDDPLINAPTAGYASDAHQLPIYAFTPAPSLTPTNTLSPTHTPTAGICIVSLNPNTFVRVLPGSNQESKGKTLGGEQVIITGKTETTINNYTWYRIQEWQTFPDVWIAGGIGFSISSLDAQPSCLNLPLFNNQAMPVPTVVPSLTSTPTPTATSTPRRVASSTPVPPTLTPTPGPINYTRLELETNRELGDPNISPGDHMVLRSAIFWAIFNESSEDRKFYGGDDLLDPSHAVTAKDNLARNMASFFLAQTPNDQDLTNDYCLNGMNSVPEEQISTGWDEDIVRIEHCFDHRFMMSNVMLNGLLQYERTTNYSIDDPKALIGAAFGYFDTNYGGTFGSSSANHTMWEGFETCSKNGYVTPVVLPKRVGNETIVYSTVKKLIDDMTKAKGNATSPEEKAQLPTLNHLRYLQITWADGMLRCKLAAPVSTDRDSDYTLKRIQQVYPRINKQISLAVKALYEQQPDPTNGAFSLRDANRKLNDVVTQSYETLFPLGANTDNITVLDVQERYIGSLDTAAYCNQFTDDWHFRQKHRALVKTCYGPTESSVIQPILLLDRQREPKPNFPSYKWLTNVYARTQFALTGPEQRYLDICTFQSVPGCQ